MISKILLGTALVISGGAALADQMCGSCVQSGWYTSLEGGANWIEDADIKGQGFAGGCGVYCYWTDSNPYGGIKFDHGWAAAGAVGYNWRSNWNLEFELAYRSNDIDCITGEKLTCGEYKSIFGDAGEIHQFSQFVNVRYDIPVGNRFYLGIGAGIGGTQVTAKDELGYHDVDYVLSGQLIGQAGYNISNRWDVFVDYRFMVSDNPEFAGLTYAGGLLDLSNYDVKNHSLMVGIRYDLQCDCEVAPPPPLPPQAPPPVVEVPREFIVFFGFNKFNLTGDAQKVVSEAASAAAAANADQIVVVGHTDSVGSPRYNTELSERRADAVRSELVRLGVSGDRISASGRGEADLMVQTGDNVREPQNRRATITIVIKAATH